LTLSLSLREREWVREKVSERKKRNRNRQATKIAMSDLTKLRQDEWLEADGLGGFASGTMSGIRTRRYHALLLAATKPPAGRLVLVNGFDAWVETAAGTYALSSQLYPPDWYRNFVYEQERARGLDFTEDLATPGTFHWDLANGEATLILAAEGFENDQLPADQPAEQLLLNFRAAERKRRANFATPPDRAADAYLVKRGNGKTIVAGYPWFTDWGRDTFISLRGLCLGTERLEDARDILLEWSGAVSEGMLPNRFPDQGDRPEYNSVDASLWYIIAVHEFLEATKSITRVAYQWQKKSLQKAIEAILTG